MGPEARRLFREAEIRAERTVAVARMAIAALLGVVFALAVVAPGYPREDMLTAQLALAVATIAGYFLLGIASLRTATPERWRPWAAWVFATGDAALVLASVWFGLANTGLPANYAPALPVVWVIPLVLAFGTLRYAPLLQAYVSLLLAGGLAAVAWAGFDFDRTPAPMPETVLYLFGFPPDLLRFVMLSAAMALLVVAAWRARALLVRAIEEARRRGNLTRFLPEQVADRLAEVGPEALRAGRRQRVAVLFADLRGFTALTAGMDPAEVGPLVAGFRARVLDAAGARGGVVDKFIGDGAMVLFGVPDPTPDDAARAVACAADLTAAVAAWGRETGRPLRIGVGVHAGEAYAGAVGDERRLEFTVLGETVNVAARLEQATKEVGADVLVSAAAAQAAGIAEGAGGWRRIGALALRGVPRPTEVLALGAGPQPAEAPSPSTSRIP
jgi:adenylate cyclase